MITRRGFGAMVGVSAVFVLGAWLGTAIADRGAMAPPIVYSGEILQGGTPVADGTHSVQLALFTSTTGPTGNLCDNGAVSVTTRNGQFSLALNASCANVFESEQVVYVDLTVDGTHLSTRAQAGAVPFSVQAERTVYRSGTSAMTDGVFGGVSSSATTGNVSFGGQTGYAGARAACASALASPTAHLCSSTELTRSRQLGIALPQGWSTTGVANSDCMGWRNGTAAFNASEWENVQDRPANAACDNMIPLLCCD